MDEVFTVLMYLGIIAGAGAVGFLVGGAFALGKHEDELVEAYVVRDAEIEAAFVAGIRAWRYVVDLGKAEEVLQRFDGLDERAAIHDQYGQEVRF